MDISHVAEVPESSGKNIVEWVKKNICFSKIEPNPFTYSHYPDISTTKTINVKGLIIQSERLKTREPNERLNDEINLFALNFDTFICTKFLIQQRDTIPEFKK